MHQDDVATLMPVDPLDIPIADDGDIFDQVQANNNIIGFELLKLTAAKQALWDGQLTRADLRIFGIILRLLNNQTRTAWPSYSLISQITGITEQHIKRCIARLRELNYLVSRRGSPPGGGRWVIHYGIGQIISPDFINRQLEAAIASLKDPRIEGTAKVGTVQLVPADTPWPPPSGTSGYPLEAKGPQNVPLEKPTGTLRIPLAEPTGTFRCHRKDNTSREGTRTNQLDRSVSNSPASDLFAGREQTQRAGWLVVEANKVKATLLNGSGEDVTRTLPGSAIKKLAEQLGISPREATDLIIEQFDVWRDQRYAGGHRTWEGQLLDEVKRRFAALSTSAAPIVMPNIPESALPDITASGGWED